MQASRDGEGFLLEKARRGEGHGSLVRSMIRKTRRGEPSESDTPCFQEVPHRSCEAVGVHSRRRTRQVINLMLDLFLAGEEPLPPDQEVDLYVASTLSLPGCLKATINKAGGLDAIATADEEPRQIEDAATAARLAEEAEATTLWTEEATYHC